MIPFLNSRELFIISMLSDKSFHRYGAATAKATLYALVRRLGTTNTVVVL